MPRKKAGHTRVDVEMPDEVYAAVAAAADRDGLKVSTWLVRLAAQRAKVAYTPPPLGRPAEVAEPGTSPATPRRKR